MGLGKRLQSLYQEILKKGEKSADATWEFRQRNIRENGNHAVAITVGSGIFETRINSREQTTDVKHSFRKEMEEWIQEKTTLLVEGLLQYEWVPKYIPQTQRDNIAIIAKV